MGAATAGNAIARRIAAARKLANRSFEWVCMIA
jgi:hypothetical protein